jgi:Mn2+/Fe2+ NRAMP family transporter
MTNDAVRDETWQPARRKLFQVQGPGLITGASDDDPGGIATYSQVGAQFGYGLAWTLVFSYPLMAAIQEISVRIGRVTGFGIAGRRCRAAFLYSGQLFRAGTLDGVALTSNSFLVRCLDQEAVS